MRNNVCPKYRSSLKNVQSKLGSGLDPRAKINEKNFNLYMYIHML